MLKRNWRWLLCLEALFSTLFPKCKNLFPKCYQEGTKIIQFSSAQSLSRVRLLATLWITACQASLFITNSRSLPKPMSIESVIPSSHLILRHPLLLLPPILPSIRIFSNELTLLMRWPKYWSFSFNISPSIEHPGLISFRMDWLDLLAVQDYEPLNLLAPVLACEKTLLSCWL